MAKFAIHASRNAALARRFDVRTVVIPVAAAAFLSLTDAFGLEILPLGERLLYWLFLLGLGQVGSQLIGASLDPMQGSFGKLVLVGAVRCILISVPVTLVVWLVTAVALSQSLQIGRLPWLYLPVLVVVAAMLSINLLTQRRPVITHAPAVGDDTSQTSAPPPILMRLPPKLRGAALCAVQAEDHYVRLHTDSGSDLVLLRFADALNELRGLEGGQVHRSWWVARDAVASSRRKDGKLFLVLAGGMEVPVSRTFARALQADGWF
jgi:LytTr DNA-binding domain